MDPNEFGPTSALELLRGENQGLRMIIRQQRARLDSLAYEREELLRDLAKKRQEIKILKGYDDAAMPDAFPPRLRD